MRVDENCVCVGESVCLSVCLGEPVYASMFLCVCVCVTIYECILTKAFPSMISGVQTVISEGGRVVVRRVEGGGGGVRVGEERAGLPGAHLEGIYCIIQSIIAAVCA